MEEYGQEKRESLSGRVTLALGNRTHSAKWHLKGLNDKEIEETITRLVKEPL